MWKLNTPGIFTLSNCPFGYVFLIAKYLFEPVNVYNLYKLFLWFMVKSLIDKIYGIIGIRLSSEMLLDIFGMTTCLGFGLYPIWSVQSIFLKFCLP